VRGKPILRVVKIVQDKYRKKIRTMKFSFDGRIIRNFIQSERSRTLQYPKSQNQEKKQNKEQILLRTSTIASSE
jgi:hypothetical protein